MNKRNWRVFFIVAISVFFVAHRDVFASGFSCDSGTLSDTCTVSSLKTITGGDIVTGSGNLIVASGGELRVATTSSFGINMGGDITIQSGGSITGNLSGATSTNFTVDAGGFVNVNAKGYTGSNLSSGNTCTGCGGGGAYNQYISAYYRGSGGGYGGNGGNAYIIANTTYYPGGYTYGSTTAPIDYGSGGGGSGHSLLYGGNGGGAIKIVVSQTLTNNGTISANGANGASSGTDSYRSGGGSGGSIYIQATTITGSGTISSNGGNPSAGSETGGGGGGGRIALYYTNDSSNMTVTAYAGGSSLLPFSYGGAGTIFRKKSNWSYGDLTVDNSSNGSYGYSYTTLSDANYTFSSTTVRNSAFVTFATSTVVNFSAGDLFMSSFGGIFLSTTTNIFNGNTLTAVTGTSSLSVIATTTNIPTFNTVTVNSQATLTHASSTHALVFNATNVNIASGGAIDVTGKGYAGGNASAGSTCTGCGGGGGYRSATTGGGGGYGGAGGSGNYTGTSVVGGIAYGSTTAPTDLGSGGGSSGSVFYPGGYGGGAIKMIVSQLLQNNGYIRANGQSAKGSSSNQAGGGSGGSIWIRTNSLSCPGSISADGGNGYFYSSSYYGGSGAGGRVVLSYGSGSLCNTFTANGGTASGYGLGANGATTTVTSPNVSTQASTYVATTTATLNGSIDVTGNQNSNVVGFAYGTDISYGATTTSVGNFGIGSFTYPLTGLGCNTTYHIRAYASNLVGTGYGSDTSFTTSPCLSSVTTNAVSSIGTSSALFNANITATGGSNPSQRGFVYGLNTSYGATSTENGSFGTGAFSASINNLLPNVTYHLRAYTYNAAGLQYGSDQQFITNIDIPSVSTLEPTNISGSGSTIRGQIGSIGGDSIVIRGFSYGVSTDYTSTTTENGSFDTGLFSQDIAELNCASTYHYRAYATNSQYTGYGTDQTFTTSACPVKANEVSHSYGSTAFIVIPDPENSKKSYLLSPALIKYSGKNYLFMNNLANGSRGYDVIRLQLELSKDKNIYPSAVISGIYGDKTTKAIKNFQLKFGIIKNSKDKGAGVFGPKTRAFINSSKYKSMDL